MIVIKRNGEEERFNPSKVIRSLRNSGVSEGTIEKVLKNIKERNFSIISTEKLYSLIYKLVRKYENKYAATIYTLKKAILRLGPDGYSFEDFFAKILRHLGYEVKVRQIYESMCITHELDVVGKDFFVECKYHNEGGTSTPIKDVMYSHARFLDLKHANKAKGYNFQKLWIATNTRFSPECIDYGEYWKIKLISWKYKGKESLSYIIDKHKLYPITMMPSLSRRVFKILSDNNIILLKELCDLSDRKLLSMGLNQDDIRKVREDCEKIVEASNKIRKSEDL